MIKKENKIWVHSLDESDILLLSQAQTQIDSNHESRVSQSALLNFIGLA